MEFNKNVNSHKQVTQHWHTHTHTRTPTAYLFGNFIKSFAAFKMRKPFGKRASKAHRLPIMAAVYLNLYLFIYFQLLARPSF